MNSLTYAALASLALAPLAHLRAAETNSVPAETMEQKDQRMISMRRLGWYKFTGLVDKRMGQVLN